MSTPKNSLANKSKAWSGRFAEPVNALVQAYTSSLQFDQRLALVDIAGSLAHAEMLALTAAAEYLGNKYLNDCTLFVTVEPCVMCAGAIINARVGMVVFGAPDLKAGAVGSLYNIAADPRLNHEPVVRHGVLAEECASLLHEFFSERR